MQGVNKDIHIACFGEIISRLVKRNHSCIIHICERSTLYGIWFQIMSGVASVLLPSLRSILKCSCLRFALKVSLLASVYERNKSSSVLECLMFLAFQCIAFFMYME